MKIILLAAAAIGCGVLMQKVYQSSGGLTFNDMTEIVQDGTKTVTEATESVESTARHVGAAAAATSDAAASAYDALGEAATDSKKAVDGVAAVVTGAFAGESAIATSTKAAPQIGGDVSMPVKRSAMNIAPMDLPPIERESGDAP